MIHYQDKTFCTSPCANTRCTRRFTEQIADDAARWWGGPGAPIALCDFRCEEMVPLDEEALAEQPQA